MDPVDRLVRKLIAAFEPLQEELILEELAIPEDLQDPQGIIDLWVAGATSYGREGGITVGAQVKLPTDIAFSHDREDLSWLIKEELLGSATFLEASRVATIVGKAADERGIPSSGEAELN